MTAVKDRCASQKTLLKAIQVAKDGHREFDSDDRRKRRIARATQQLTRFAYRSRADLESLQARTSWSAVYRESVRDTCDDVFRWVDRHGTDKLAVDIDKKLALARRSLAKEQ